MYHTDSVTHRHSLLHKLCNTPTLLVPRVVLHTHLFYYPIVVSQATADPPVLKSAGTTLLLLLHAATQPTSLALAVAGDRKGRNRSLLAAGSVPVTVQSQNHVEKLPNTTGPQKYLYRGRETFQTAAAAPTTQLLPPAVRQH